MIRIQFKCCFGRKSKKSEENGQFQFFCSRIPKKSCGNISLGSAPVNCNDLQAAGIMSKKIDNMLNMLRLVVS